MQNLNFLINEIFDLYKIEEISKLKKYFDFFKKVDSDFSVLCVSEEDEEYHKCMVEVEGMIKKFDNCGYVERLIRQESVYKLLRGYDIDRMLLSVYKKIEKNEGIIELLNGFMRCEKIRYTRSNIVSGRLSIVKGPRFMQLPKKYRNVVKSRFSEGEILMVDYVSLEPRVARYIVGGEAKEDIYQGICDELDFAVDRAVMKRAVISILYGASEEMEIGELSQDKIGLIRNKVNEYFNINHLLELAMKQDEWGYRRSFWGRPIHWGEDVRLNQILNGYIQSTAVDVALDGFLNLIEQFNEGMRPLFFIHDAMFVDVKKDCKNDFVNIIKQGYNCKELGFFPLNIELISERKY